ncbi:MAG: hypothetical protein B7X92_10660, partial [Novosphingobium sp. 17-62-9]
MQLVLSEDLSATLLQVDTNGGGDSWQTVLVLQGLQPNALTRENFSPEHAPDGAGIEIIDGPAATSLNGTSGDDSLYGGGGADYLYGNSGNDLLDGGTETDHLFGGRGDDFVFGDDGDDQVYGDVGNDDLSGGEGNDNLYGGSGDDALSGDGGGDYFADALGNNTFDGGSGDDQFGFVGQGSGVDTFTGGTGRDQYNLNWTPGDAVDTVTDFATGAGGDVLDINYLASGFSSTDNPFLRGFLRLEQDGADTLLQYNADGIGDDWQSVLRLAGTVATSFTYDNFGPQFGPDGTGATIIGTASGEFLYGTVSNDTIEGRDGADYVYGGAGLDTLLGEGGNDTLDGGTGDDTLFGGDGNDTFVDAAGANIMDGGAGDDQFRFVGSNTFVDT